MLISGQVSMPFREMTTQNGSEEVNIRESATSVENSIDYVLIASDELEEAVRVCVVVGELPEPVLSDVSVSDLEPDGVQGFDRVEGGAEDVDRHALGHDLG